jgi:cupin fold WbuC family metalloprotein
MKMIQLKPELFLMGGLVACIGNDEIQCIRLALAETPKRRARINVHQNSTDTLHEMFIAIERGSYIRPHMHLNKIESFHLVEGEVSVVIFNQLGDISQVVELSRSDASKSFFYRLSAPFFHTLIIRSEILIMHEVTNGPFNENETIYAEFAPSADNVFDAELYMANLEVRASQHQEQVY